MRKLNPFEYLNRILFHKDISIRKVLLRFNETALFTDKKGFGIVIDGDGVAVGVATDGDIRRKISLGMELEEPIHKAMQRNFK